MNTATRIKVFAAWAVAAAAAVAALVTAEKHGPVSPENTNPAGIGKPPPIEPLWPSIDFVFWGQVLGAVLLVIVIVASVLVWRRRPGHPVILMILASSTLFWWDPINNWAIGLVYNPKMWHFPRDWPWLNISPISPQPCAWSRVTIPSGVSSFSARIDRARPELRSPGASPREMSWTYMMSSISAEISAGCCVSQRCNCGGVR